MEGGGRAGKGKAGESLAVAATHQTHAQPRSLGHLSTGLLSTPVPLGSPSLSLDLAFVPLIIPDPLPLPLCSGFLSASPCPHPARSPHFLYSTSPLLLDSSLHSSFLVSSLLFVFCPSSLLLHSFLFLLFFHPPTADSVLWLLPSSSHPLPSSLHTPLPTSSLLPNCCFGPPPPFPSSIPRPLPSCRGQDWRA